MFKGKEDARFSAILDKTYLAEEFADLVLRGSISKARAEWALERLSGIESFIGKANQPSAQDSFQSRLRSLDKNVQG